MNPRKNKAWCRALTPLFLVGLAAGLVWFLVLVRPAASGADVAIPMNSASLKSTDDAEPSFNGGSMRIAVANGRSMQEMGAAESQFGYGLAVGDWDAARVQSAGFNWMMVFNPPRSREPVNILYRLNANASHLADLTSFGSEVYHVTLQHGGYIEAYEIGNEVNLNTSGWGDSPDAFDYVQVLCEAYRVIKTADPTAIVVSAGLAPTGRVTGMWNGHLGHDGSKQDEREYLKELIAAGGDQCFDVVGYHPLGFSADYNAVPDQNGGTPETNCSNGFCFRGVEKIHEIMQAYSLAHRQVWATEIGWIVGPQNANCLVDPRWQGRAWQIVSPEKQASNLVGAFQYARLHWPWMGAMFVFNLNFNTAQYYDECEQMRYYGVQDRTAEAALAAMPKQVHRLYLPLIRK